MEYWKEKEWFFNAFDLLEFDKMSCKEQEEFCDKAVEKGVTIKDVLYTIALVACKTKESLDLVREHIEKGYHKEV